MVKSKECILSEIEYIDVSRLTGDDIRACLDDVFLMRSQLAEMLSEMNGESADTWHKRLNRMMSPSAPRKVHPNEAKLIYECIHSKALKLTPPVFMTGDVVAGKDYSGNEKYGVVMDRTWDSCYHVFYDDGSMNTFTDQKDLRKADELSKEEKTKVMRKICAAAEEALGEYYGD